MVKTEGKDSSRLMDVNENAIVKLEENGLSGWLQPVGVKKEEEDADTGGEALVSLPMKGTIDVKEDQEEDVKDIKPSSGRILIVVGYVFHLLCTPYTNPDMFLFKTERTLLGKSVSSRVSHKHSPPRSTSTLAKHRFSHVKMTRNCMRYSLVILTQPKSTSLLSGPSTVTRLGTT